jgi:S1-C subfamily serine protease
MRRKISTIAFILALFAALVAIYTLRQPADNSTNKDALMALYFDRLALGTGLVYRDNRWIGQGVFVNNSGTVVTAAHLLKTKRERLVYRKSDGSFTSSTLTVTKLDETSDLAICRMESSLKNDSFVEIESSHASPGKTYYVWPSLADSSPLPQFVPIQFPAYGVSGTTESLVIQAQLFAGSSGSAVTNMDGKLVGILSRGFKLGGESGATTATGNSQTILYMVPRVRRLLNRNGS